MKNILIVKTSSLGDIIHVFPAIEYLKQCCPDSSIDWVVEMPFAQLVQAHPFIYRALGIETKKWRAQILKNETRKEILGFRKILRERDYDLVLDLQGNIKSAIVTALAKSPLKVGFSYSCAPEWPNIFFTHRRYSPPAQQNIRQDYLFIAQRALGKFETLSQLGIKLAISAEEESTLQPFLKRLEKIKEKKVLVCPGSNWANKQLSKETLTIFLQAFLEKIEGHFVFVWGYPSEKAVVEELANSFSKQCTILPKLSLPSLQNLMGEVDLVLAMDSLPLHLAGTTKTPTYSVFGASSASKYKPIGEHHAAFQGSCPYGKKFEKRCDILRTCQTGACIKQLQGRELFDHFYSWWSSLEKN